MTTLWVEKYRPTTLDTFVGNDSIKSKIDSMIKAGNISHILLFGSPGTGKTTLAKIIRDSIDCDYLYINASSENGVDVIRDKIQAFAATMGFQSTKLVILDEADYISAQGQAALRNVMEEYSESTRFILTCNYVDRLIPALISRTQQFHIEPSSKTDIAKKIVHILGNENVRTTTNDIVHIIETHYPDIRKIINECQNHTIDGVMSLDGRDIVSCDDRLKIIDILTTAKNSNLAYIQTRQLIADIGVKDFSLYYQTLYDKVDKYGRDKIPDCILVIADGLYKDALVVNKEINFMNTILQLFKIKGE